VLAIFEVGLALRHDIGPVIDAILGGKQAATSAS